MAKTDYSQLVDSFEELMGGKGNISSVTHCVTRVRTMVKDKDLVQEDAIKKIPGVVTGVWAGNQYQIVIGKDVEDVYDMICDKVGVAKQAASTRTSTSPRRRASTPSSTPSSASSSRSSPCSPQAASSAAS